MSAGKDDRVDSIAARFIEHRLDCCFDGIDADRFTGKLRLGELDELWRTVTDDGAVRSEFCSEILDIGLTNRRLSPEHPDDSAFRNLGRWLDCRNGADDRKIERRANMLKSDGRCGVAGDDRKTGMKAFDDPAQQRRHPARDLRLASAAIRETRAVGGVYDGRVGEEPERRLEHRQAADA